VGAIILGEEMIIGLVFFRTDLFGDRFVPFIGIGKNRVDIEDDAPEVEQPVLDDLTNLILRFPRGDGVVQWLLLGGRSHGNVEFLRRRDLGQ